MNKKTKPPVIKLTGMHRESIRETKTEAGHTPGPWEASTHPASDPEYCHVWAKGRGSDIALVVRADNESMINVGSAEANARLIAAGPEMLEALKDMIAGMGHIKDCGPTVEKARAAIAKAEGGAS